MTAVPESVRVTGMLPEHAEQVLAIHQLGIDGGDAPFETTAPSWEAFDAARLPEHRPVAVDQAGRVLGWAAVAPVSDRARMPASSSTPPHKTDEY